MSANEQPLELAAKYNMLLIFDCPKEVSTDYQQISESIVQNSNEILMVFLDQEIPQNFKKAISQHNQKVSSNNNLLATSSDKYNQAFPNLISTYNYSFIWMLIGLFSAQNNKHLRIFTDTPENFKPKLLFEGKLKSNIDILKCQESENFSMEQTLNAWNQFDNQEALSNFEIQQLTIILKKFIKQIVTSKSPNNLEKLLNISQNLVKAHMSSIQKEKFRVTSDLTFHFIRSLFLDNVLENNIITTSILTNQIQSVQDFENFTRINYTPRFQTIIENIKSQIQLKQQKQAQMLAQGMVESPEQTLEEKKDGEDSRIESEEVVIKSAIQTLLDQYLNLFQKAKIFEIKKLHKLVKQIQNYVTGFIMKKETAPKSSKDKAIAAVLSKNQQLISVNILRVIARLNLIKMVDQNQIDHEQSRVNELLHDHFQRQLKDSDLIFDKDQSALIFEQPLLVFKKDKEEVKQEQDGQKKDQVEKNIDKLYIQMKSTKHFPNSLRDLERFIKKNIIPKGVSEQDEEKTVEQILKRMVEKCLITQKTRTGESKEHIKDPKLKNISILELYKREKKEDIPIVLESSNQSLLQQQQQQQHQQPQQHAPIQKQQNQFQ